MATTLERQRYDAVRRNQATMQQVNVLLERETTKVLSLAQQFDQQQMGGYLRTVVPGLVDRYGNVNATAAMDYYNETRLLAGQRLATSKGRAQRIAGAKLQSQFYVAKMQTFDSVSLADPIIGVGMKALMADGFGAMSDTVTNAMTRAVGSYNRDTIIYNAGLDDATLTVQRVAEPNACAFCALLAFSSTRSVSGDSLDVRTTSYAVDFHNNCHCSLETIYEGDTAIRPDYYDQFEADYLASGTDENGSRNTTAKEVLTTMRQVSGRS